MRSTKDNLDVKLLRRSIGEKRIHQSVKPIHGDHYWTKNLDIVNELGGHTGCVNALSWSTSGTLLASGSDDTYLNIWEYNPSNLAKPFTLNTSVSTGHQANIFSVKFMPHSNDRTVVTCAGDSQVRIFDIEYQAGEQAATGAAESTRSRRFGEFFGSCKWLTTSNTNARVYRSHGDRAKRIVTESSPYLFLSCSEDGEVRQWDLRQPSSAYPAPRDGRHGYGRSMRTEDTEVGAVPPPLISYKSYGLDLNTISCSKSQPHYIALGGRHLHCFLHDRRMLGRNVDAERGKPTSSKPLAGTPEDESMREATRCVRRFAPNNKRKMKPGDSGHITACKISDARPNELISSWSGDHVYSFDIIKGPDAREVDLEADKRHQKTVLANRAERKRKRTKGTNSSNSIGESMKNGRRLKTVPGSYPENDQTELRVQHENGDSGRIEADEDQTVSTLVSAHEDILSEAQKQSERIARSLVDLRKTLYDFSSLLQGNENPEPEGEDLTHNTRAYTSALGQASVLLPKMEEVMKGWTYPNTVDEDEIMLQNTLRRNRQSSWRFVQAVGALSSVLGGKLQTVQTPDDTITQQFSTIRPAALEGRRIDDGQRFCYDFVKAITLWLRGGQQAVLAGFKRPPDLKGESDRFPFDESVETTNVAEKLREYLIPLADDEKSIVNLGTNRFERDELRQLFDGQKAAVLAFTRALEGVELRRGQGHAQDSNGSVKKQVMDLGAAARFWGEKVGRALLMDAAEGVAYNFVNRAFGGLQIRITPDDEVVDRLLEEAEEMMDEDEDSATATTELANRSVPHVIIEEAEDEDELMGQSNIEEEDDDDNYAEGSDDERDESESEQEESVPLRRRAAYAGGGALSTQRATVNDDTPYTSHTKVYKGHCNSRTVKDVNYYGPDDEYIVSGSDDGHFFIWDRKTMEIVSVLEGDGEVVNVVQGHPYEPMIACSGIDSTIKIFGPDGGRERYHAGQGVNIANPGGGRHSSLGFGFGRRRRRPAQDEDSDAEEAERAESGPNVDKSDDAEAVAPGGLKSRRVPMDKVYEITSQNNAERQRGMGETFMTQGMLTRLLLQAAQNGELQGIQAIGGRGLGGEGGTVVVDENCSVM